MKEEIFLFRSMEARVLEAGAEEIKFLVGIWTGSNKKFPDPNNGANLLFIYLFFCYLKVSKSSLQKIRSFVC